MSFPVLRFAAGFCTGFAVSVYFGSNQKSFFGETGQSEKLQKEFQPTKELFAKAIEENEMCLAEQILQRFSSDKSRMEALKFKSCHHGTLFQDAALKGNVKLATLHLKILCNKETCSKQHKQRADDEAWDKNIRIAYGSEYALVNLTHQMKKAALALDMAKTKKEGVELLGMKEEMEAIHSTDLPLLEPDLS